MPVPGSKITSAQADVIIENQELFAAQLAGSTPTPLMKTKLEDMGGAVFNVLAYGADPTGDTDSTTAIVNTIAAAEANGGGVIFFPPGIYVTNVISLPYTTSAAPIGIHFQMSGLGATIFVPLNANTPIFQGTTVIGQAVLGMEFRGGFTIWPQASGSTGPAIYASQCNGCHWGEVGYARNPAAHNATFWTLFDFDCANGGCYNNTVDYINIWNDQYGSQTLGYAAVRMLGNATHGFPNVNEIRKVTLQGVNAQYGFDMRGPYSCGLGSHGSMIEGCVFTTSLAPMNITGCTYSGSTVTLTTNSTAGLNQGDPVQITGVGGLVNVNGVWQITSLTSTTVVVTVTSTPTGTYTSGGTIQQKGAAILPGDKSVIQGIYFENHDGSCDLMNGATVANGAVNADVIVLNCSFASTAFGSFLAGATSASWQWLFMGQSQPTIYDGTIASAVMNIDGTGVHFQEGIFNTGIPGLILNNSSSGANPYRLGIPSSGVYAGSFVINNGNTGTIPLQIAGNAPNTALRLLQTEIIANLPIANFQDYGGQVFNVKAYGAKANGIIKTNGTGVATGTSFTDVNGAFTSVDVGKAIVIQGAGATGFAFATTISAYSSATAVTLAAAVTTNTTTSTYAYGTDDTAAIQSAYTAAAAVAGTALHSPGISMVTGQLTGTAGLNILGRGATLYASGASSQMILLQGANHIVERLTLDGGGGTTGILINGGAATNWKVRDCILQNCKNAIEFANVSDVVIEGNIITNWWLRGIYPVLTSSSNGQRVRISNNLIENYVGNATLAVGTPLWFDVSSGQTGRWQYITLENNRVIGPGVAYAGGAGTSDQIHIQSGDYVKVHGNWSISGGDEGISMEDVTEISVVGNHSRLNQTSGLNLGQTSTAYGVKGGAVTGNVFVDNNQNGATGASAINFTYCTDVVSNANRLGNDSSTHTLYGYLIENSTNVTVGPDDYATCTSGYIQDGGSNTNCLMVSTVAIP